MDRAAWQAAVHGGARVGRDWVTEQHQQETKLLRAGGDLRSHWGSFVPAPNRGGHVAGGEGFAQEHQLWHDPLWPPVYVPAILERPSQLKAP